MLKVKIGYDDGDHSHDVTIELEAEKIYGITVYDDEGKVKHRFTPKR